MSVDLSKVIYSSTANSFKNTGVFSTSVTLSGTVGAGASVSFSSVVTLSENQVFSFFIAEYADLGKVLFGNTTRHWQRVPTLATAYVQTTPTGNLGCTLRALINGSVVTFTATLTNPYAGVETITSTTINIRYVTYTLAR
jgi:hypothetical protein